MALFAVLILLVPGWADGLQYDRQAIASGQVWRLLTGNLTHWNTEHAFWDVLMFVVLGVMIEGDGRRRFVLLCLAAALGISLTTWFGHPDVQRYRGLSGIDTALFVYLAYSLLFRAWQHRRWSEALIPAVLLVGFSARLLYEAATGAGIFVDTSRAGFTVLAVTHVAGTLIGASAGGMSCLRSRWAAAVSGAR
jgi:rhomboid family GlyGly-CTERM serine protease